MLCLFSNRQCASDVLALAAVTGAVIGFVAFMALGPGPSEAEWKELVEAPWVALNALGSQHDAIPDARHAPDAIGEP